MKVNVILLTFNSKLLYIVLVLIKLGTIKYRQRLVLLVSTMVECKRFAFFCSPNFSVITVV